MPYLDIFGLEFKNPDVIFEISTLEFVLYNNFQRKCLNLGSKMLYLDIYGKEFHKTFVVFEISTIEFV